MCAWAPLLLCIAIPGIADVISHPLEAVDSSQNLTAWLHPGAFSIANSEGNPNLAKAESMSAAMLHSPAQNGRFVDDVVAPQIIDVRACTIPSNLIVTV
jgi:hypothetical protein